MNMRRALTSAVAVSFLVAIVGGLTGWGGMTTQASEWNTTLVSVSGTVAGQPENVVFSGEAQIDSRLALDETGNGHDSIVFYIDFGGVLGVGASTAAQYVISSPAVVQRPHTGSDMIEIVFPFSGSDATGTASGRSGLASFSLNIDTVTGAVMSATGGIGNVQ